MDQHDAITVRGLTQWWENNGIRLMRDGLNLGECVQAFRREPGNHMLSEEAALTILEALYDRTSGEREHQCLPRKA